MLQVVDALAVVGADHEDLVIDPAAEQGLGQGQQPVAADEIDLVQRQYGPAFRRLQPGDD